MVVIPRVRPTVPIAEPVSNKQVSRGKFSNLLIKMPLDRNKNIYINKIAPALRTASSGILLPKHSTSFFLENTEMAARKITAKVVVFIPPAVDPGEPPISIRSIIIKTPDSSICERSVELKPAVLVVTD